MFSINSFSSLHSSFYMNKLEYLSCFPVPKIKNEKIEANKLASHSSQLLIRKEIWTSVVLLCRDWTWTGLWLLAIAKELKISLMRIFASWNDIIGCLDEADLACYSFSPRALTVPVSDWQEFQKAYNAKKDLKYPKATQNSLYNPRIIWQNSNCHFKYCIFHTIPA